MLLAAAFVNGFPIVYSDTATYLASGFTPETPFDRPITYGLFLRAASLNGVSLWGVVAAQALIVSYVLYAFLKPYVQKRPVFFLGVMGVLSASTGLSWTVCQLMPDIFTPVALLAGCVLLVYPLKKGERITLYLLFFLSTAMHLSHITFNAVFLSAVAVLWYADVASLRNLMRPWVWPVLALLTVGAFAIMGSALSKSRHVFLMGALVENGIAKAYLDEYCAEKNYKLCAYKDTLPTESWEFIWNPRSPFYQVGAWNGSKAEFNEIIRETYTRPKYIGMQVRASASGTLRQLRLFKIGDGNGVFLSGTVLHARVAHYFPQELQAYSRSAQNRAEQSYVRVYNRLIPFVVIASLLGLLLLFFTDSALWSKLGHSVLLIGSGIVLNAWICATFANAIDRLGSKMIWLLPLLTLTVLLEKRRSRTFHVFEKTE